MEVRNSQQGVKPVTMKLKLVYCLGGQQMALEKTLSDLEGIWRQSQ